MKRLLAHGDILVWENGAFTCIRNGYLGKAPAAGPHQRPHPHGHEPAQGPGERSAPQSVVVRHHLPRGGPAHGGGPSDRHGAVHAGDAFLGHHLLHRHVHVPRLHGPKRPRFRHEGQPVPPPAVLRPGGGPHDLPPDGGDAGPVRPVERSGRGADQDRLLHPRRVHLHRAHGPRRRRGTSTCRRPHRSSRSASRNTA